MVKKRTKKIDAVKKAPEKKVNKSDAEILAAAKQLRKDAKDNQAALGALDGQQLVAQQRPGYVRRWARGTEQRLDQLKKKGYSFVLAEEKPGNVLTTDIGTAKSQIVGTDKNGGARRDYLMEIPEELYREDLKIKENKTQRLADAQKHVEHDVDELATPEGRSKIYQPF